MAFIKNLLKGILDNVLFVIFCLAIVLCIISHIIHSISKLSEIESNKIFIYIPGKYCVYIHNQEKVCKNKAEIVKCDVDQYCLFQINNSFGLDSPRFYGYKIYEIKEIGYFEFDFPIKPKTYFIEEPVIRSSAFSVMFITLLIIFFIWQYSNRKLFPKVRSFTKK
jgi:hypothetical protein